MRTMKPRTMLDLPMKAEQQGFGRMGAGDNQRGEIAFFIVYCIFIGSIAINKTFVQFRMLLFDVQRL